MSIALMTSAWKSSYPAGKKMVLLALCDNANDQGECFPSISMLAEKCSMSERSVFNQIADLEKDGAVRRENRAGRSTIYHLDPCKFCTPERSLTPATVAPTPANSAGVPLQRLHPTPATISPTPATVAPITIKESSSNRQRTIKEPGQLRSQLQTEIFDADAESTSPNAGELSAAGPPEAPTQGKRRPAATVVTKPVDVADQVWADWLQLRKTKRAPVTQTVLDGAIEQAALAGMTLEAFLRVWCQRGSQGLQASWLRPEEQRTKTAKSAGKHTGFAEKNYHEGVTEDGYIN